jgi:DNA repair exonuclease SbcCD nuclease subunit
MTKIIAIGDPHIKLDNFDEFNLFEESLHHLIDNELPDLIVVLGDILHYHEKIFTPCLNRAYHFIKKLGEKTKTFVLVGNHDMINNQQFLSQNHWMNSLKKKHPEIEENIVIVDTVVRYSNFVFCPYVFPGRFTEALRTLDDYDYTLASVIFAHQEFRGCKMGAITSEEGDLWEDSKLPLVVSGHVHLNQWVGDKVYYTGSALQHAFGESERNIIAVITVKDKDNINIREIDLELPRKKIISTDVYNLDKVADRVLNKIKKGITLDKIKISISGSVDEFKNLKTTENYKKLVKEGVKVVFKQKQIKNSGVEHQEIVDDNFSEILRKLIIDGGDVELYKIYEKFISV